MANSDAATQTNNYLRLAEEQLALSTRYGDLTTATTIATAQVYATMAVAAATRDYEGG